MAHAPQTSISRRILHADGVDNASRSSRPSPTARNATILEQVSPKLNTTTAATIGWLDRIGASDRSKAAAAARVNYEDASQVIESWADLTAWSANNLTVAGGYLQGSAGATRGANRSLTLVTGEELRIKATINVPTANAATAASAFVGVSVDAAGAAFVSGNFVGIGVTEDNIACTFIGSNVGGAGTTALHATPLPIGDYYVTVMVEATSVSLSFVSADAMIEFRAKVARPANVNNVTVFNSDSRAATGVRIGKLGYRRAVTTLNPRTGIEGLAPSTVYAADSVGQAFRITEPKNYDPRKPTPLVIAAHGKTGTENFWNTEPAVQTLYSGLLGAGYLLASHNLHGDNWGNQAAVDDIVRLYNYAKARYNVGPVLLMGQSMGGMATLNAIHRAAIPVYGWAGIMPVVSLQNVYTANVSGDQASINTAYGIAGDYTAKTLGYDPCTVAPEAFRGLPMRFYASTGDTRIPQSTHTDVLRARVLPVAKEASYYAATGDHGNATHYVSADLLSFFSRCLATA